MSQSRRYVQPQLHHFVQQDSSSSILGNWMMTGNAPLVRFVVSVYFGQDGVFKYEMAGAGSQGSFLRHCEGQYKFYESVLQTQANCNLMGPLEFGGKVQLGGFSLNIGGEVFHRQ